MKPAEIRFSAELERRKSDHLYRQWGPPLTERAGDFISNDYLGFSQRGKELFENGISEWLRRQNIGSTGSRLVSGQHEALVQLEDLCCSFFESDKCLFFPNGYMANLALLSTVASRHDTYIYDEQCHVSLKDGMRLSMARRISFRHNDMEDLKKKLKQANGPIFIVTESIFSMDGDVCPLEDLLALTREYDAHLIIDEAHSTGTYGIEGKGLCLSSGYGKNEVWARIYTFGKALGASGAVLAISDTTYNYLVNHSHPVIYSTAPMPFQAYVCMNQLDHLTQYPQRIEELQRVISYWNSLTLEGFQGISKNKKSPVQYVKIQGNQEALACGKKLQRAGFQVKAMLSPTVSIGNERLRISLHSYNTVEELDRLKAILEEI